jgi:hypothetical protein
MDKRDCIYPDCQQVTDFGSACEHSCPFETVDELKYGYIFHLGEWWYPWSCNSDEEAIREAEANPGIIKVTVALSDRLVWEAPSR